MKTKLFIICFFSITLFCLKASAQNFDEEFKKFADKNNQSMKNFKDSVYSDYENYVKKMDKDFSSFLRKSWKEFAPSTAKETDNTPEPQVQPKYKPEQKLKRNNIPLQNNPPVNISDETKLPLVSVKEKEGTSVLNVEYNFYGASLNIRYDASLAQLNIGSLNNKAIADTWDKICSTDYNLIINQLLKLSSEMKLNDWAYLRLVQETAKHIFTDKNRQDLLTWFIMSKSRYLVRIGYADNKTYLLISSDDIIYQMSYILSGKLKYYILSQEKVGNIVSYDGKYSEADRQIEMTIREPMNFPLLKKERRITFSNDGEVYSFTVNYNQNLIDFYKNYPQCELPVYFSSAVSSETKLSLLEGLSELIKGKSQEESLSILLSFVQNAFAYKTDIEQYGYQKYDFSEEMIYYPYCACDDRAIFFNYIVKSLLKLDVIGLTYPGHICDAVNLPANEEGDYVMLDSKHYIVCDPTYIGAPVGATMPQFKDKTPEIILSKQNILTRNAELSIWKNINRNGGFEGDNGRTIVSDTKGNIYVTGYFSDTLKLSEQPIISNTNTRDIFFAKFNKEQKLIWVRTLDGSGNDMPFTITLDKNGNGYIVGSFDKEIKNGQNIISTIQTDLFSLKFDHSGKIIWLNKLNISSVKDLEKKNYFISRLDTLGVISETALMDKLEISDNYQITVEDNGACFIAGVVSQLASLNHTSSLTGIFPVDFKGANYAEELDISNIIIDENNKLVKTNCNTAIAGLFAVINLVNTSGSFIPGNSAQKALDKANPTFKTKNPKIYQNIGKINIMKNNNGIITIQTKTNDAVVFSNCEISNGARVKITTLSNGSFAKLDVISGVKVGKAAWWYNLNYIQIQKNNDQMLFDYDTDHTQKSISLKSDILD